jgi:hypothetical protein
LPELLDKSEFAVESGLQVADHDVHQLFQSDLVLPPPVLSRLAVVDHIWPGISDRLSVVRLVLYLQGHALVDGCGELLDGEADGCHVVACAHLYLLGRALHQLDGATHCVVHEDHGDGGLGVDEALVAALLECPVEDADRVVSGASAGQLLPADNAGVPETADVEAELEEVVLSQEL